MHTSYVKFPRNCAHDPSRSLLLPFPAGCLRRHTLSVFEPHPGLLSGCPHLEKCGVWVRGACAQTQETLDFCAAHGIAADIQLISPKELNHAMVRPRAPTRLHFVQGPMARIDR